MTSMIARVDFEFTLTWNESSKLSHNVCGDNKVMGEAGLDHVWPGGTCEKLVSTALLFV